MITPEQEEAATLNRVIEHLETLGNKDEETLSIEMHQQPKEYARLLVAISALTTKACGNMNKVFEMVTTLELCLERDGEKYEVRHVKHEYGADIVITNKETLVQEAIESKHSMTVKSDRYKTDWNFTVRGSDRHAYQREPTPERLAVLIGSLYKKQSNGVSCLSARTGTELLHHYQVSGAFIALYCAKKLMTASCNSVNLGCQRCVVCGHYHRALSLQAWGKELESIILVGGKPFEYTLAYFTDDQWRNIFRAIPSQCVVNGIRWLPSVTR